MSPNTTMNLGSESLIPGGTGMAIPMGGETAFKIGPRLGRAGEVYEAHHPGLACLVALKFYRRAASVGATAVEALSRDALRASGLRHPHIAQVIEAGAMREGTPFTAFELLTGHTLEERMVGRGAFLATELLPLVRGTASALSAAHAAGVFHRELRPDNIFVVDLAGYEQGFVKLLDFGACHLTAAQIAAGNDPGTRATRNLAPEQLAGHVTDGDARTDQFALASITYRMLNGIDPQVATRAGGSGTHAAGRAPVTNLARRAPAVDAVVSKALNRDPEERFESVALFLRAFEEALTGASLISTPGPLYPPPAEGVATPPAVRLVPGLPSRSTAASSPSPNDSGVDPSSLSQRFFEEGDLQEATSFKNVHPEERPARPEFDSFDRIPTRRKPMLIALLLMVMGIGGAAWWAGVRVPEAWRRSAVWQRLPLLGSQGVSNAVAPESGKPLPPAAAPTAAPSTTPAPPVAPTAVAPPVVEPPVVAAPPVAPPSAAPAGTPPSSEAAPTAEAATEAPTLENAAQAPATAPASPPVVQQAETAPTSEPASKPKTSNKVDRPSAVPRAVTRPRTGPLYLWSPEKQSMVPVPTGEATLP